MIKVVAHALRALFGSIEHLKQPATTRVIQCACAIITIRVKVYCTRALASARALGAHGRNGERFRYSATLQEQAGRLGTSLIRATTNFMSTTYACCKLCVCCMFVSLPVFFSSRLGERGAQSHLPSR